MVCVSPALFMCREGQSEGRREVLYRQGITEEAVSSIEALSMTWARIKDGH